MHRTRFFAAVAGLSVLATGMIAVPAAQARPLPGQVNYLSVTSGTVTTLADETRVSTLALTPSAVAAKPLDRLGWKDKDPFGEPHLWVFTPDSTKVLGRTIDDGAPCALCDTAISEMAAALALNPGATRVEHGQSGGLDVEGDAYLLRLGDDVWVRLRATPGTVLYYLDAYHPWLHGQVTVTP